MPEKISVSIFFHQRVSIELALLAEFVLSFANRLSKDPTVSIKRISYRGGDFDSGRGITVKTEKAGKTGDYLIIPPMNGTENVAHGIEEERQFLQRVSQQKTTIASTCLGALILADAGLLDDKEATTHWRWGAYAAREYPQVRWNTRAMICEQGNVITSGGLLSIVDLCLYLLSRHYPAKQVKALSRRLLTDSVRQKQSVYAQSLILPPKEGEKFKLLESEMKARLSSVFPVEEMASFCGMSLRNFHRSFLDNYGITPNKYQQLMRIEKAREYLRNPDLTLEDITSRCGLNDPAYLRKIFARETGFTPSQYRKSIAGDDSTS